MIDLINKIFVLEDDTRYSIIETINYENKTYAYLVNIEDELDSMFKEVILEDNNYSLNDINSELFSTKLLALFIEKMSSSDDNTNREDYRELENIYKKYFEIYLNSQINLKGYDELIKNSELDFGILQQKVNIKSNLEEYLNLNYFYILNNFYIEKLTDEEKLILRSNNEEEIFNLIKNTYKNIITYTREDIPNKRFKINYTFSTSKESFSYNDELVVAIYYGKNTIDLISKENYLDNYHKKQEFLNDLSNNLSNDIKSKLDLDSKIIYLKI